MREQAVRFGSRLFNAGERNVRHAGQSFRFVQGDSTIGQPRGAVVCPVAAWPGAGPAAFLAGAGDLTAGELTDVLCTDQRERWLRGEHPEIEAYLQLHGGFHAGSQPAIDLIFGEFLVRRQLGESPTLDEYGRRFPDLAEQLRLHVGLYDALDEAAPATDDRVSSEDPDEPAAPSSGAPSSTVDYIPADEQPRRIGRYRIERILGKGGFGLVYLAHDDRLQRLVAIKVPHRGRVERPEDAGAYVTEARTIANLDHPNIGSWRSRCRIAGEWSAPKMPERT